MIASRRPIRSTARLAELTAQRADCATLAAVNRAGFVTRISQRAGADVVGGLFVKQRAYVEGFASEDVACLLQGLRLPGRLMVIAHGPGAGPFKDAVSVHKEGGVTLAVAGEHLAAPDIEEIYASSCSAPVVAGLCSMWQVAVIEKDWGSNVLLWPALAAFTESAARCFA